MQPVKANLRVGANGSAPARTLGSYLKTHDAGRESREQNSLSFVNQYYDLVTDFYEFGWGTSFHFAPRTRRETFEESLARHERRLANALRLNSKSVVLDVGCGVGGPMREIASSSGARVVGVNNNEYQIERGERHNEEAGLTNLCSFRRADFGDLPFDNDSFDAAYAIESTCHAASRVQVFKEIARVLKPGGEFAGYEWCLTGQFRLDLRFHKALKVLIEKGDALPELAFTSDVDDALREAGLEIVEAFDCASEGDPKRRWYTPLDSDARSIRSLPRTPLGRWLMHHLTWILERTGVAAPGTNEVQALLNQTADALVDAGRLGIFTPMYYFRARKVAPRA